jgi:hypothetical protein
MFYFFQKGKDYIRCELRDGQGGSVEIVVTEANGHERVERYTTTHEAHERWERLQQRFSSDGWFGPFGRE